MRNMIHFISNTTVMLNFKTRINITDFQITLVNVRFRIDQYLNNDSITQDTE